MLKNAKELVSKHTNIAIDTSDISKEFAGKGMEGMEDGRDASRKTIAKGHAVLAASIVPKGGMAAIPLVVRVHKGRRGVPEAEREMITRIFEATSGHGQLVMDRGYDSKKMITFLLKNEYRAVIRGKESIERDIFGDGVPSRKTQNNPMPSSTATSMELVFGIIYPKKADTSKNGQSKRKENS